MPELPQDEINKKDDGMINIDVYTPMRSEDVYLLFSKNIYTYEFLLYSFNYSLIQIPALGKTKKLVNFTSFCPK